VNVVGSLRLLQAAVDAAVKRFIFASSGGAIYGEPLVAPQSEEHPVNPISPYGCAKLSVEHYLQSFRVVHGLSSVALRYANVYGPRQDPHGEAGVVAIFSRRLLSGESARINGDGKQTRDFVYVGDVAEANVRALESDAIGSFNVGTGVETDINAIFQLLRRLTGSSQAEVHGPPLPGEQQRSVVDARKIEKVMGWRPTTSLEAGLTATARYFREAQAVPARAPGRPA